MAKLTTCDDVFAALSVNGEVFVFTTPDSSGDLANAGRTALIKPQKAWVLKKKYRAVKVLGRFTIRAK
jgi:inhibitor of Bruton tyrosine kinase